MTQNQIQFITKNLIDHGFIRRNACLRHFISRLGARICDLNKAGWEIEGHRMESGDYEYRVLKFPKGIKSIKLK